VPAQQKVKAIIAGYKLMLPGKANLLLGFLKQSHQRRGCHEPGSPVMLRSASPRLEEPGIGAKILSPEAKSLLGRESIRKLRSWGIRPETIRPETINLI